MKKEAAKQQLVVTPWIFLLLLIMSLLYLDLDLLWRNNIQLEQHLHYYISSPETISNSSSSNIIMINQTVEQNKLDYLLSSLVKGEDQEKLKANGFVCNTHDQLYSKHCVASRAVMIDTTTNSMTVIVPSNIELVQETVIRPYARQDDEDLLLKTVTPVKILEGNTTPLPLCQYNHKIPAVVFSSSGFVGNIFHEMNEIIIPLFITTRQFNSRALFIMEDYSPSFIRKYGNILSRLTSNQIMNPAANPRAVHCFPGAVIGLKFHGHLALNSSATAGVSMREFRQFLRESLNLKYSHVSRIYNYNKRPTVMLLSRRRTRRFLNEDEIVGMMEELGFRVIVVGRAKVISNLEGFSSMINSCSVFVGAHGAGLTNELFLADGAVMVQVDLIGLEWAAATYYGNPARAMSVHYLRYKIEAEESSLFKVFYGRRNHTAITDPKAAFPVQAGKEVYLNGQNVRINVARFRETMVEAMSLVRDYSAL